MDLDKEVVYSDPETEDPSDRDQDGDSDREEDEEDKDEDRRIFNVWMQRCRGELLKNTTEQEPQPEGVERTGSRASVEPPQRTDRRASLPCPVRPRPGPRLRPGLKPVITVCISMYKPFSVPVHSVVHVSVPAPRFDRSSGHG